MQNTDTTAEKATSRKRSHSGETVALPPAAPTSSEVHPFAHLPIVDVPGLDPKLLKEQHPYEPFDAHVIFYDNVPDDVKLPKDTKREHLYLVNDMPYRGSCTGFLGEFFGEFDTESVAEKIVGSWKWNHDESYRYYKKTAKEIAEDWQMANKLGTRFHYCVELFFNGLEQPSHPDFQKKEYAHHFRSFYNDHVVGKLRPWRTEWIVFDRLYELVGSIDMVFQRVDCDNPYSLVLYDWKRCLKIDAQAYQNESATGPFEGLPKANFWKYALQLNTYKFIIERNTPYRVEEMVLLRCHPDSENYEKLVVPDLQQCVRRAIDIRWRQIMQLDLELLATLLANPNNVVGEKETKLDPISLARQTQRRFEDHSAQIASGAASSSGQTPSKDQPPAKKAKTESFCSRCTKEVEQEKSTVQIKDSKTDDQMSDPRFSYSFQDTPPPNQKARTVTFAQTTTTTTTKPSNTQPGVQSGYSRWKNNYSTKKNNDNEKNENGVDPRSTYVFGD